MGSLVDRAHLKGSPRDTPHLNKSDIKMINEAFEEDLERFERHAEPHKPERHAVNFLTQVSYSLVLSSKGVIKFGVTCRCVSLRGFWTIGNVQLDKLTYGMSVRNHWCI